MRRISRVTGWLRRGADDRRATAHAARSAAREEQLLRAARAGFSLVPAAHPAGYGCSCDRVGCPHPAAHPVSFAWQTQAADDPAQVRRWLTGMPEANFVAVTGRTHDVLDVPEEVGRAALERIPEDGNTAGPLAVSGEDGRHLFFTATRAPLDEDEWWPCELDAHPESSEEHPGLRWHCRGSYVLLPPSRLVSGSALDWHPSRGPELPLPDPLRVLDVIAEVWEGASVSTEA